MQNCQPASTARGVLVDGIDAIPAQIQEKDVVEVALVEDGAVS